MFVYTLELNNQINDLRNSGNVFYYLIIITKTHIQKKYLNYLDYIFLPPVKKMTNFVHYVAEYH